MSSYNLRREDGNVKKIISLFMILGLTPLAFAKPAQSDFNSFWQVFKTAVVNNDKNAVAGMVNYPFETYAYDRTIKTRTKPAFLKLYKQVLDGEVDAKKCFATAKPRKDTAKKYSIACPFRSDSGGGGEPFVYTFVLTKTGWKFAGFENINE